jgi:PAS domain S-box-containing protein
MKKTIQYFPFISLITIFMIDLSLIYFNHSSWNNSMQQLIPIKQELTTMRNKLSEGHLWLEEIISGDTTIDINKDVFNNFDYNRFQKFSNTLDDSEIEKYFSEILVLLRSLENIVKIRWNNVEQYGIGSDIDQNFDQVYANTLKKIDNAKIFIDSKIDKDFQNKDKQFLFIIFSLILINSFIFYLLYKFTKKENKHKQKLNKERNKYKQLMNLSTEMIFILDLKGNLFDYNLEVERELQYLKDELQMINVYDWDKKITKEVFEGFISQMLKEEVASFETVFKRKDGSELFTSINEKIITIDNNQFVYVTARNITQLKQLENQSKLASMGEMIGNIAHQWRQPLSVISTGATGISLKIEYNNYDIKEIVNICNQINENAQYLSQTIDDFRNFVKGDTKPVNFGLRNKTDSFIKLVDTTIKNNKIQIILDLQEHIKVKGYPNELIQCFINIFNNSKDAFVEKNIDESERFVFINQEIIDNSVKISFKDNAGGIPDSIISKIFEPYFTTKHQSKGTGLGLHMSYNLIVNQMKGSIKVSNETYEFNGKQYKGAMFIITLPFS